jgi:hypothetical protein
MAIDPDALAATIVANFAAEFGEIQPRGLVGLQSAVKAIADGIAAAHNADTAPPVVVRQLDVGELLWEWNGIDTTQFDTPAIDVGVGGDGSTTMSLSVVDRGAVIGNVLRTTLAVTDGGGIFFVSASELTLPTRYVAVCRHYGTAGTGAGNMACGMVLWSDANGNAMIPQRTTGNSNLTLTGYVNAVLTSQEGLVSGGTLSDPATIDRRGILQIMECHRQAGTSPKLFFARVEERMGDGGISNDATHSAAHGALGANWDGLDCTRFGVGVRVNIANVSGTMDLAQLQIYAHPED